MTATLLAVQKLVGVGPVDTIPLWKVVLTRSEQTPRTYTNQDRFLKVRHIEEEDNGIAEILLDNSDGALTLINFEQYQAAVSYGYRTSAGDEYSPAAPLKVVGQQFFSAPGALLCSLYCVGIPNDMKSDKAIGEYLPESTNTDTLKTLITAIAGATPTPYNVYSAYTVTYDSEDSLIDSFKPADYFSITLNENREEKIQELINYTGCKKRAEDDGEIHVLVPTTSLAVYDYEYRLSVATYHTFVNKTLRNRFVDPNKEIVKTPDSLTSQYTGNATSATSYALNPKIHTLERRITSDAQGTSIAEALIERHELDAELGSALVPMNCGQEIWDYVKFTDARENDSYVGNVQYIERNCDVRLAVGRGGFDMFIRFGKVSTQSTLSIFPTVAYSYDPTDPTGIKGINPQLLAMINDMLKDIKTLYEKLNAIIDILNALWDRVKLLESDDESEMVIKRLHVTERLRIPVGKDMFGA